ncbi:MAG: tetratricopeptide repeat protein [Bacteroidota bacterium]
MKLIKSLAVIMLLIASFTLSARQNNTPSVQKLTYSAYVKNTLPLWEKSIELHKKSITKNSPREDKLALVSTYYGYLSATMATKDEDAFEKQIDPAKELVKALIEEHEDWGEPKALLSSIMGLEMAYSPMKGAFLGMKSNSLMSDALKESPESPLVMRLYAGSKQYTPAMWGGDKKVAADYMEKAIKAFEQRGETVDNWLYIDALANLGIVYSEIDKKDQAKAAFQKALNMEPEFGWVKYSLMPQLADNDDD